MGSSKRSDRNSEAASADVAAKRERERGGEGERGRAMIICDDERRNKKNQQVNTTKQHISATAELGKMENDTRHEKAAVQHITRRQ